MSSQASYITEQDHNVYDDILDKALAAFEGAATKFSVILPKNRLIFE